MTNFIAPPWLLAHGSPDALSILKEGASAKRYAARVAQVKDSNPFFSDVSMLVAVTMLMNDALLSGVPLAKFLEKQGPTRGLLSHALYAALTPDHQDYKIHSLFTGPSTPLQEIFSGQEVELFGSVQQMENCGWFYHFIPVQVALLCAEDVPVGIFHAGHADEDGVLWRVLTSAQHRAILLGDAPATPLTLGFFTNEPLPFFAQQASGYSWEEAADYGQY